jgi:hypothetical protein
MAEETKYKKSGKAYYEANKAKILEEEKDRKRWLSYYDRNKAAVKERNRERYYARKGLPLPPPRVKPDPPAVKPEPKEKKPKQPIPEKSLELKRLEALVVELRGLIPEVMRKKARPTADREIVTDASGSTV